MTSRSVRPGARSRRCSWLAGTSCSRINTLFSPPIAIMASFIPFSIPFTIAAIATRLETPSTMPSIVRIDLNLCVHTSFNPINNAI
jgi:hypothetical protein